MPCPHESVCCSYGTDLSQREAEALVDAFGSECVDATDDEPRTSVVEDRCFFQKTPGTGCSIHGSSLYPAVCRAFPESDGLLGGPYVYVWDCPEINAALEFAREKDGQ